MKKRQKLGQHFLISKEVAKKIVSSAQIKKNDTVLEIGTGKGILTPFLCKSAKKVISIETDKQMYNELQLKFSEQNNLKLILGNGFKSDEKFSIFVSNLPYSQSRNAIEWLIQKKFTRAIVMVQKEFAQKLCAFGRERSAISVLTSYATEIEPILKVNKNNFEPKPKVDSIILRIRYKKLVTKEMIEAVNILFSSRRKKLVNVFKKFDLDMDDERRIDELPGDEIIKIAKKIIR